MIEISRQQAREMAEAHAEGLHDELAREGCPECEGRELREYPAGPWDTESWRRRRREEADRASPGFS